MATIYDSNGLRKQLVQGALIDVSAGTTHNNLSAITFSNSNGVSFGINASTLTGSISQTNQQMTLFATSNTTQSSTGTTNASSLIFAGAGIASVGITGGSIVVSATQSNQAFSAAGGSSAFQTLSFADTNSVSWTNTAGSIGIASIKLQMFAVGNTTQSSSGTANHTAHSFGGSGILSVGVTGGTVNMSAAVGTATNITGNASITLGTGGNISFNGSGLAGTNSGATNCSVTVNSSGVSVALPTLSRWVNGSPVLGAAHSNTVASMVPLIIPHAVAVSGVRVAINFGQTTTTNTSSASQQVSVSCVLYTRNVSTLSSINSGSTSYNTFWQSNSTSNVGSQREIAMSLASVTTLQPGEYWFILHASTNNSGTGGNTTALGQSLTVAVPDALIMNGVGAYGVASATTQAYLLGRGNVNTGGTLGTIPFSNIIATNALNIGPWVELRNYSIW